VHSVKSEPVSKRPSLLIGTAAQELHDGRPVHDGRSAACAPRQLERAGKPSSRLGLAEIERDCRLRAGDQRLFGGAIERLGLSPRAVHRILRVARTVADLAGLEVIGTPQLTEAITYRRLGRKTGS
jgi:magnesium chelatase family protein